MTEYIWRILQCTVNMYYYYTIPAFRAATQAPPGFYAVAGKSTVLEAVLGLPRLGGSAPWGSTLPW